MKRKEEDRLFSLLVRTRAGWNCEKCGKNFEADRHSLHCSHFRSRRYTGTRWFQGNAAAHCAGCHRYLGEHPHEFGDWIRSYLGDGYEELLSLSNRKVKWTKADKAELRKQMREELKRMEETPQTDFHLEIVDEVLSR